MKMKVTKAWGVYTDGYPGWDITFRNKSDQEEMALAMFEEFSYEFYAYQMNEGYPISIQEAIDLANEHIFCYDTVIVGD